jgi:hypothetical protein
MPAVSGAFIKLVVIFLVYPQVSIQKRKKRMVFCVRVRMIDGMSNRDPYQKKDQTWFNLKD